MGEPGVPFIQDSDVPRPAFALEHRREAVQRDQDRRPPRGLTGLQCAFDTVVVGLENLAPASVGICRTNVVGCRESVSTR
jgi:hypothetical protein